MTKKVKRNLFILLALLVANVIGFILADSYFKRQADTTIVNPSVGVHLNAKESRVYFTQKLIGLGIDYLRKIGE